MSLAVDWGTKDSRRTYVETDLCTRRGAAELKRRIEVYWAERGVLVDVKLHEAGFSAAMRSARFDVRSEMKNGFPPGYKISI